MLSKRPALARGHADHGWLNARHTFSFANYYDPRHQGFRALRVINEDRIAPAAGFGMHGHQDMEIITWLLGGSLRHHDSLGSGAVLRPGDAQVMSAGTGIRHSEVNASTSEPAHLLQIWIEPRSAGIAPRYADRHFPLAERTDRLRPIATGWLGAAGTSAAAGTPAASGTSEPGRDGSLPIHADADVFVANLSPGAALSHDLAPGRHAWIQVAHGALTVNGLELGAGDGLAVSDVVRLDLTAKSAAEILLFDLG